MSIFAWVSGSTVAESGGVLPNVHTEKGDSIQCEVTPSDGTDVGETVTTLPMTIINSAPVVDTVSIAPELISTGDVLMCTYDGFWDPDGLEDENHTTFRWTINGADAGTGDTLVGGFSGGDLIGCHVLPADADDTGIEVAAYDSVENSSPTISGVSIDPIAPTAESVLTCGWTGWMDIDGDPDLSIAEWSVDTADDESDTFEVVGTGTSLAGMFFGGDRVKCTVSAFDGTSVGTVLSTMVTVVVPSA